MTGLGPHLDAVTATNKYMIFGFTGSVHTCLDFAIDGYTIWGHPLVYAINDKIDSTVMKKDATDNNTLSNAELIVAFPYSTAAVGDNSTAAEKGVNAGQIRAIVEIVKASAM